VTQLTRAAESMAKGDYSVRARIDRADEIGRLAATFDRMADAVQTLDNAKSEFVRTVSHEQRTPLTSIKLSIANLADGVGGPTTFARVRNDLDRLIRLVNDLLDLARLNAGDPLRRVSLDLGFLLSSAAASLEPIAAARNVTIAIDRQPAPATADQARLTQVATNLLDNAIKFSPTGGTIRVTMGPETFSVTDEGPGVPPERRQRIFEPFSDGGGLGLTIARRMLDLHGGTIALAGDTGSTFVVTLPAAG
jgi:signal transduction histidine kinase